MDDVQGRFLGLPHDTTPACVKTCVMKVSKFQTIFSETFYGLTLTGQTANTKLTKSTPNSIEQRTVFIRTRACQPQQIQSSQTCREQHRIWECQIALHKDVSEN